tara:strand:- start:319 stop:1329 length:1011 start_codon:yes stop_codon:yes gene_type:complete
MKFGNALLHLIGGDESSKGIAGAVVDTVKEEQAYNRDLIKESAKTVIQERLEEKKRRKQIVEAHKANLDMLKSSGYNIDNSLSIAKAGMTDKMLEWAAEYRGDADGVKDVNKLWTFTGNSVAKSNLTHREFAERIAGPEMFTEVQYGDLEPSNSFLSAIGIPQDIGGRIKQTVDAIAPLPAAKEMEALNISGTPSAILASQVTNEPTVTKPTTLNIAENWIKWSEKYIEGNGKAGISDTWTKQDQELYENAKELWEQEKMSAMGRTVAGGDAPVDNVNVFTLITPFENYLKETDPIKKQDLLDEIFNEMKKLKIPPDLIKAYEDEIIRILKAHGRI